MGFSEFIILGISIIAVIIALYQANIGKQQLDLAKTTKTETEKVLEDIKSKVQKIEMISDETRKDVKDQISKLIDKQDENFKVLLNAPEKNSQNEMIMSVLPQIIQNPEMFKSLMKIASKK